MATFAIERGTRRCRERLHGPPRGTRDLPLSRVRPGRAVRGATEPISQTYIVGRRLHQLHSPRVYSATAPWFGIAANHVATGIVSKLPHNQRVGEKRAILTGLSSKETNGDQS